jgi:hypothetical protein
VAAFFRLAFIYENRAASGRINVVAGSVIEVNGDFGRFGHRWFPPLRTNDEFVHV